MRRFSLLGTTALGSAAVIGLSLATAAPAFAQTDQQSTGGPNSAPPSTPVCPNPGDQPAGTTTTTPDNCLQGEVELESGQNVNAPGADQGDIVVTGSRIRSPNITSNVPVTSVSATELLDQGDPNIGDALNDLPAIRSTYSQANSTRFIGTAGLNLLDLRGLGVTRTLVLVNGRRHITASAGSFVVDVQTIPTDLVQRVDVVTGGNSAIYGSDAVAGVVNFVLRRDFDGVRLRAQAGISDEGDRGISFAALTAGQNFAGDRGNVAINLEYVNSEPLFFRQRDSLTGAFSGRCQFQQTDATAGEPAAGDGIPDITFMCGVRNATLSEGGTIGLVNGTSGNALRFDNAGNIFLDIPPRSFVPIGSGNQQGGQGTTLRETGQIAPGTDRYSANLLAHFELSEAFRPFIEAKYVHLKGMQEAQPSFFQGQLSQFFAINFNAAVPNLKCDNPFLSAQNITFLRANGFCGGATFNPNANLPLSRFNSDFGGRQEDITRNTYRVLVGVEGDFNEDWRYEVSFNYGRFDSSLLSLNALQFRDINGNPTGFATAVDAVRNAQGQIVCRINADANPANDDPRCVPLNLFGRNAPSAAALAYINTTTLFEERADQYNALAILSGDLSQLFELPGGPIRFAIGSEYRRETAFSQADPLSASGATFFNAFAKFDPPAFEVKEVFGEVQIPILRDMPFARELTLSGAARYSDYNTAADKTFAYNLSGTYAPVSDIRFRANYSQSVRVPTLGDLFSPQSQGFAFITDPCNATSINNGPNRVANCAALGVPTTVQAGSVCAGPPYNLPVGSPFINCVANANSTGFLSGGNPNLEEETAKSLTLGAVFTPRFLPGFSLTVDYYDIRVKNLIATLTAQAIINQCVDEPTTDNTYCDIVFRDAQGLFKNPATLSGGVNFAQQHTQGIDFDASYRHSFGAGRSLNLRAIATRVLKLNNFVNPVNPGFANRQLSELGDPKWAANFTANMDFGAVDFQYSLEYIGRQVIATPAQGGYEAQNPFQGRPPTNADLTAEVYYPSVVYHGARLGYTVNENFRFYMGVDNLLDRQPPLGLLGGGAGDPFDPIGRYFYAGAQVDF